MFKRRAHRVVPISPISVHVGVGQRCRARDEESPATLPTIRTRDVPAGRWMEAQEQFKRRANPRSLIIVHVGVGQRCRAQDEESPASLPTIRTRDVPSGCWMKVQGKFKMQARSISGIVVDIAAFKVSHSFDQYATAQDLQAARERGQAP